VGVWGSNPAEKGKTQDFTPQSMRTTLIVITPFIVVPFFVFCHSTAQRKFGEEAQQWIPSSSDD
jgi:hypothetical protein